MTLGKAQREAIWDYDAQPKEWIDACPLCDHSLAAIRTLRGSPDRYGYHVGVVQCTCGLNFLNPRMTREAYARFYETAYRPLVSAFHGREINAQTIQPEQLQYGRRVADILWPHSYAARYDTLLDIGGSTGVVASEVERWLGVVATVLDPAAEELRHADLVAEAIPGFIEDYDAKGRTWDLITLCQTADHLLDLMGSLRKIKGLLSPEGLFWSDIVNFDKTREVKIDHPFNLTERTYREFLKRAGFKLLQINYAPDGVHIGFLAR